MNSLPPTQGRAPPLQDIPLPLLLGTLLKDILLRDTLHSRTKDIQSILTSPTLVTQTTLLDPLGHTQSSQDTRRTHNHNMVAQCMGNLLKTLCMLWSRAGGMILGSRHV